MLFPLASNRLRELLGWMGANPLDVHRQLDIGAMLGMLASPLCPHRNLRVSWASNTTETVMADELILFDAAGAPRRFGALNVTMNIGTSGANGLDTGSPTSGSWYYRWAIGNPSGGLATLYSLHNTSPVMPAGYTFKGLIGNAWRSTPSNNLRKILQQNTVVAQERSALFTSTNTGGVAVSINYSAIVPPIVKRMRGYKQDTPTAAASFFSYLQLSSTIIDPGFEGITSSLGVSAAAGNSSAGDFQIETVGYPTLWLVSSGCTTTAWCSGWEY